MNKRKIKILMISSSSKLGGGPTNMFMLGENLKESFDIFYALPKGEEYIINKIFNKILYIKERSINFQDLLSLRNFILKNKIELIHAHGKGASVIARIIKVIIKIPIIYTYHGIHLSCHSLFNKIIYLMYEKLTGFLDDKKIFVSISEKDYAKKLKIYNGTNSYVINNGINNRTLKNYNLNKKSFSVISVCRFVKQKNLKEIIDIARLSKDINFKIIGDGPSFSHISNYVRKYGLKNIKLIGKKQNVFDYLYDSDVYLTTSLYEGLPISVIEAMSIGLPIVASNVIGNCDTIIHSCSGYLYELNDIKKAASYLEFLKKNKIIRKKIGLSSQKRQRDIFSIDKMLYLYKEVYYQTFMESK